jgi:lysophospholipase L1-like esterase
MGLFRYVALGDSSAVGIGAAEGGGYAERIFQALRQGQGAQVGFLNLGVSGATSQQLVDGPLRQVASKRPHLVTLGIGSNDVWRLVPAEAFARNVERMGEVLEATGARVLICNLIDLALAPAAVAAQRWTGVPPPAFTERVRALNRPLEALAARPNFELIDLFAFSQRELPAHPEYFCDDGFHPSSEGYARWAELFLPSARQALEASRRAEQDGGQTS